MAAILSALGSVNRDGFSAMLASDFMAYFLIHLVEMSIPPLISTFVAAKFPWLGACFLNNLRSAVLTLGNDGRRILLLYGWLFYRIPLCRLPHLTFCFMLCRIEFREGVFPAAAIN